MCWIMKIKYFVENVILNTCVVSRCWWRTSATPELCSGGCPSELAGPEDNRIINCHFVEDIESNHV